MFTLLSALGLIACQQPQETRVLSICLDEVSREFLSAARVRGTVPNLERLASMGLSYEVVWTAPSCSPSRARFMLGRYHTGVGNNFTSYDPIQWSMDPRGAFPQALPGTSVHVGKWHLAGEGDLGHPVRCGFQTWAGSLRNLPDYYDWEISTPRGTRRTTEYATEWVAQAALEVLPHCDFLSIGMNAAHHPLHEPPPHLHTYGDLTGTGGKTKKLAILEAADTTLGPLIDAALELGFVVFVWSDNGGKTWCEKGTMSEEALNTFLIVAGDGVRTGVSDQLVDQVDLAATISELMGGTFDSPDSRSFVHDLRGLPPPADRREWAYCEAYDTDRLPPESMRTRAIRDERWKLIVPPEPGPHEVYDLLSDPGESTNLWPSLDPEVRLAHDRLLAAMP